MDRKRVTGLAALLLTVGTFFLLLLPSSFCISAAPPSLWMESAESVHPGDIVSVELWLTGEGLEAVVATLCCSPPDKLDGYSFSFPSNPTLCKRFRIASFRCLVFIFFLE